VSAESVEFDETVALRDLIETDARLVGRVGVGAAPKDPDGSVMQPPYVVLTGSNTREQQDRFAGPVSNRRPSWVLHATGSSELAAIAVLGWVHARLDGKVPVVAGRKTKPIRRIERPGNAEDDVVRPSVWYAIAVYAFESDPITANP
jgi:hypothetical protein